MSKKLKINIIDILVILVIVALVFGAWLKFSKFNEKTDGSIETTLNYALKIYNIRDYSVDAFKIGDVVYDSLTGVNIGTIESIEKQDALTYEQTKEGELVKITNPYRRDIVVNIKTPGSVETDAYYANKSIELKVNSQKTIETKYIKTTGTVAKISAE